MLGGSEFDGSSSIHVRQAPVPICNTCPAHRTKQKQINKMTANANAQYKAKVVLDEVEDEAGLGFQDQLCDELAQNAKSITNFDDTVFEEAHGKQESQVKVEVTVYHTSCKALLVGIGADGQMAGYGRHRTVFLKALNESLQHCTNTTSTSSSSSACHHTAVDEAVRALESELNKDLHRLWKRNLGRFVHF